MYTIAVSNEKGGVAKTTTTISLGAALAETGLKVLIIDLDPQANLTLALGIEPDKVRLSITNVLLETLPLHHAIQGTSSENLDILCSNHEPGILERLLPQKPNYEGMLRRSLEQLKTKYDYVIMDCPPFLGAITQSALVAAQMVLIPTQAEYFSIVALRNLMGWIRQIRAQHNPALVYRLLLTMYDRRNRTHRILSEQLRNTFRNGVLESLVETDTKLRESPIVGVPILTHAPKTRASGQYRNVAQEIIQYVKETTLQPS
ncbi:MAG: ParA family protein [Chloroflexi bacterium]|jgi:chromosome partitioning protein|nr:ParA family protein [Anaerolineaceae bacterium]NMB88589.1 ParA family protein [Chloroflexota bacterium]